MGSNHDVMREMITTASKHVEFGMIRDVCWPIVETGVRVELSRKMSAKEVRVE